MKSKRGKPNDESSRKKRKKIESQTRKHVTWDDSCSDTLFYIDINHPSFQNTALKRIMEYKLDSHIKKTYRKSTPVWKIPFFNDDLNELVKETMEHYNLIDVLESEEEQSLSMMRFYHRLQTDISSVTSQNAEYTSDEQPAERSKHVMHIILEGQEN